MYWVYGGSYSSGYPIIYGPERIGDVADVVLVVVNYRLGPLGNL